MDNAALNSPAHATRPLLWLAQSVFNSSNFRNYKGPSEPNLPVISDVAVVIAEDAVTIQKPSRRMPLAD